MGYCLIMSIRINGDNTTAAPGIAKGDDTDTGIQFGTDEVSIVTGGVERAKVDNVGRFDVNSGSSGVISAKQNTNNGGFNIYEGKDSAGNTQFYVTHNGRVGASEGVIFGTDTAATNVLNDYEEGTWTPDFSGRTSAAPNIQDGVYRKIGKQVFAYFHLNANATLTSSISTLRVVGLPFNPTASGNVYGHTGSVHFNNSFSVASTEAFINGLVPPGTTYINFYFNQGAGTYEVPVSRFGTGNVLACAVYFVD